MGVPTRFRISAPDPALKSTLAVPAEPDCVMVELNVSVPPVLTANLVVLPVVRFNTIDVQDSVSETVTVIPALMVIVSLAEVGGPEPPQVAELFQLPETLAT